MPIMVSEVVNCLEPGPGQTVVDCTLGYGGHARKFLQKIGPEGRLIGLDCDAKELARTAKRLKKFGDAFVPRRANFSELEEVLGELEISKVDIIFADLGLSSMQIDDPGRGIHYKNDGPLDMRMDDRLERTAADVVAEISEEELAEALWKYSDEPDSGVIAAFICGQRQAAPITRVDQLKRIVLNAKGLTEATWKKQQKSQSFGGAHPAARTFQALRILVNDELGALEQLLEAAPGCVKAGGRIGIISFHAGEDRLVKNAFREGLKKGVYQAVSKGAITPRQGEIRKNPRSSSARFRWAQLA
nr:16S rRNA (cytosine(1402)-N(4))-methyltransferase RsmH [Anaerohalosphaera lusitana]